MKETVKVEFQVDSELLEQAETILEKIGLDTSEAVRIFYHQIVLQKGIPFSVKLPDEDEDDITKDVQKDSNRLDFERSPDRYYSEDEIQSEMRRYYGLEDDER